MWVLKHVFWSCRKSHPASIGEVGPTDFSGKKDSFSRYLRLDYKALDLFQVFGNKLGSGLMKTPALFVHFRSQEWETGCYANVGRLWLKWLIWIKKLMEKEKPAVPTNILQGLISINATVQPFNNYLTNIFFITPMCRQLTIMHQKVKKDQTEWGSHGPVFISRSPCN